MAGPTTYPFTMGTTCVTPSPESMMVPVKSAVDDFAAERMLSDSLTSCSCDAVSFGDCYCYWTHCSQENRRMMMWRRIVNINNVSWVRGTHIFLSLVQGVLAIKCKNCLNPNVQCRNLKGFKHYLCQMFSVLWRVQGRFCE
jgi:hypothetical protein